MFAIRRSSEATTPPINLPTCTFAIANYLNIFITPSTSLHHRHASRLLYLSNCMHLETSETLSRIRTTIAPIHVSVIDTTRPLTEPIMCESSLAISDTAVDFCALTEIGKLSAHH